MVLDDDKVGATLDVVQQKLEELMSKENFRDDVFIQQHTNAQLYISFAVLGNHHSIAALRTDIGTLLAAARRSEKLSVDEANLLVRPNLTLARRNTLILRDLPDDVTEAELRGVFASCPEIEALESVKPDVNCTAFISFTSDKSAQEAALWLRSQKLRGASIKCSIKTENFLKGFFPAVPPPEQAALMMQHYMTNMWQAPPWVVGDQHAHWPQQQWDQGGTVNWGGHGGEMSAFDGEGFKGGDYSKGASGKDHGGKGKGKEKGKGKGKLRKGADRDGEISGAPDHGPAQESDRAVLDSASPIGTVEDDATGETEPLGYTHDYRKLTRERIIEVCNKMDEIEKPESYVRFEAEHPDGANMFRQSPCKDWAPLPTPQVPFRMAMGNDGSRRTSWDSDRKGSSGAWNNSKASGKGDSGEASAAQDSRVEDWDGWGEKGGGKWNKRWNQWPEEWEDWSGYTSKQWVEKGAQESSGKRESRRPRSRSASRWVEKGSSGASGADSKPKWQAKVPAAAAAESGNGDNVEPSEADNKDDQKPPSWADRVRQGRTAAASD